METQTTGAPRPPAARRWTFIALLLTATFINYLDRGSLSVALPFISRDLHLGPIQQGIALSSFFWAYALMQIPMGWLLDRYDVRRVYAITFALWSLSAAGTGLVRGLGDLMFFRILLGIGESVYLPGGMKVVSQHFGSSESAWPAGLFDMGAKVGLAVGTTIDVWLLVHFGWRSLFFRTGALGLLWIIPWLWLYPLTTRAERAKPPKLAWRKLFTSRALLAMSLGFFCWDYFWYFEVSWLPSYLYNERHIAITKVAIFGALPFLIFAVAEALGAWGAGALIRRGADLSRVTKTFIGVGFALGLLVVPAALASDAGGLDHVAHGRVAVGDRGRQHARDPASLRAAGRGRALDRRPELRRQHRRRAGPGHHGLCHCLDPLVRLLVSGRRRLARGRHRRLRGDGAAPHAGLVGLTTTSTGGRPAAW